MIPRLTPRRIALIYACLGAAWIVVSDRVVEGLLADRASLAAQTAKGLIYIGATTLLVYWLAVRARASALHEAASVRARADLREARAFHSALVDASPLALVTLDSEGRVLTWNRSAAEIFGWSEEEVLGEALPIVPPDREEEFAGLQRRVLAGEAFSGIELVQQRKDGTPVDICVSTAPIPDATGDVVAIMAAIEDVTERKRAGESLRCSEERFRTLIESAPDAIFDPVAGRFRFVNPACARLLGADSVNDLVGLPILDRVHPDDRPAVVERIRILNEEHRPVPGREQVMLALDGREIPVEASAAPMEVDGRREAVVFIRDVTERKRREVELRRLHRAVEQAGEAILVTDQEGTIEYVNPAFERISGYSRDEAFGQKPRIQKSGEHDEAFYREMWDTIAGGETWSGRVVNRRKDGATYTADTSISPVRDGSGEIVNFVAVQRDITRQLSLESQLLQAQKIESLGSLVGGIAHDFNNMLTVMLGTLEMILEKTDGSDPRRDDLEEIRAAALRSSALVGQLLGFARQQIISPRTLDLNAAVEARLDMLRRLIGEHLELSWRPARDPWAICMDPSQLDQILTNLLINARDATDGAGMILIETGNVTFDEEYCADHPGFRTGEFAMLAVTDSGRGMDRETERRIFDPFYTTKPEGRGTGLGLSTVYGIVKQNEGLIDVYSEPGSGSTFRIYLPRCRGESASAGEPNPVVRKPARGTETVLVVEDDPAILTLLIRQLEALGYRVLPASTPGEALRIAEDRGEPIDLILTDVMMPEMDGRALYERLGTERPGLSCLFLSGYTADVIAPRGVLEEGFHFLQKPFTIRELAPAIREALAENPTDLRAVGRVEGTSEG